MTDEAKALAEEMHNLADAFGDDPQRRYSQDMLRYGADLIKTQAREIERLNAILSAMNDTDVIARTMAENERLREALGWYEKQANDCRKITREGDGARYALDRDGGERARAALEGDSHVAD